MLSRSVYTVRQWFRSLFSAPVRRPGRVERSTIARCRPSLEQLESRLAPATFTWSGASMLSSNWMDASNWVGNIAPGAGASLDFPGGAARINNNNNFTAGTVFDAITISGAGYTLNGNQITLISNGAITDSSGVPGTSIILSVALGNNSKPGIPNNNSLLVAAGGNLNISGALSNGTNTDVLTIGNTSDQGEVTLSGNNSTLAGSIFVDAGSILNAANSSALGLSTGSSPTKTTVEIGGQLQLSGGVSIANPLLLNGTGIVSDGALLNETGSNTWTGSITLDANPTYIGAAYDTTLTVDGIIGDLGNGVNLTKVGTGTLVLDPQYSQTSSVFGNTYRGGTTIDGGILAVQNSLALGSPTTTTTPNVVVSTGTASSGELELDYVSQSSSFYDPNLILNGTTVIGFAVPTKYYVALNGQGQGFTTPTQLGTGALYNFAGNNTWNGGVELYSNKVISNQYPAVGIGVFGSSSGSTTLTINGVIDDNQAGTQVYQLSTEGLGTLILTAANTYLGTTGITEGTTIAENSNAFGVGNTRGVIVNSGATLGLELPANASSAGLTLPNTLPIQAVQEAYGAGVDYLWGNAPVIENIDGTNQILGAIYLGGFGLNSGFGNTVFDVQSDPGPFTSPTYNSYSQLTIGGIVNGAAKGGLESISGWTDYLIKEGPGELVLPVDNGGFTGNTYIYQGWVTMRTDLGLGYSPTVEVTPFTTVTAPTNGQASVSGRTPYGAALMLLPYASDPLSSSNSDYAPNLVSLPQVQFRLAGGGLSTSSSLPSSLMASSDLPAQLTQMGALENVSGENILTSTVVFENGGTPTTGGPAIGVELLPFSAVPDHNGSNPGTTSSPLIWDSSRSQLILQGTQSDSGSYGQVPSGFAGFTKVGTNELILQGDGTYSGNVYIQGGVLEIMNDLVLGTGLGTVYVGPGTAQQPDTALVLAPQVAGPGLPISTGELHPSKFYSSNFEDVSSGLEINGEGLSLSEGTFNSTEYTDVQFTEGGTTYSYDPLTVLGSAPTDGPGSTPSGSNTAYVSGDYYWGGNVSLASDATIGLRSYADPTVSGQTDNTRLILEGVISDTANASTTGSILNVGSDGLTVDNGTLLLGGVNTYRGGTNVEGGTVTVANSQALGNSNAPVTVASGAALQLEGNLSISNPLTIQGQGPATAPEVQASWFAEGPASSNSGSAGNNQNWSGPVTGVVVNPNNSNIIYITTAGGGAWETTDGGQIWNPLFDYVPAVAQQSGTGGDVLDANSMYTSAITIDPQDPNIIYVALGNPNNTADAYYGDGILYTTNGGQSWSFLPAPYTSSKPNLFEGKTISKIVIDPWVTPYDTQPTSNIPLFAAVSNTGLNSTSPNGAQGGIWYWGPTGGSGSAFGWTNLTNVSGFNMTQDLTQQTLPPGAPSAVTFSPSDDYTGLVAYQYMVPLVAYAGSPLTVYTPPQPVTVVAFSVGTPGGGSNNAVYYTVAPEYYANQQFYYDNTGFLYGAFNAPPVPTASTYYNYNSATGYGGFWNLGFGNTKGAGALFPIIDSAGNPANGNIQLAFNGRLTNTNWVWQNSGSVYAAAAYDSNYTYPLDNQLRNVYQATVTANQGAYNGSGVFTPQTPVFAFAWTSANSPANANTGTVDWNENMALTANASTGVVYLAGGQYAPGFAKPNGPWSLTGSTWASLAASSGNNAQLGDHALALDSSGNLYLGTDGGLWELPSPGSTGSTWQDLNGAASSSVPNFAGSLQLDEIAGLGTSSLSPDSLVAATQWDGASITSGTDEWSTTQNGTSDYTQAIQVSPVNPSIVYLISNAGTGNQQLYQSTNGGQSWTNISKGDIFTQFVMDPLNPSRLVLAGESSVVEITTPGSSENIISLPGISPRLVAEAGYQGVFAPDLSFQDVTDQGPASDAWQTIYAVSGSNQVYVTKDNGVAWAPRTNGLPSSYSQRISSIVVDPRDRDVAYVTYGGFGSSGQQEVYMTTNAGQNWTNISASLPENEPAWSLVIDPRQGTAVNPTLYLGTEDGVFVRYFDPTQTNPNPATFQWAALGSGLPAAQVRTLVLNTTLNTLVAGTYGRGVFEIFLPSPISPTASNSPNTTANAGAFQILSGNSTWSGPVTLSGTNSFLYLTVFGSQSLQSTIGTTSLTISGNISDVNSSLVSQVDGLVISGGGTVVLGGNNSYEGTTTVLAGVLDVQNPDALGGTNGGSFTPSALTVDSGAALYLQSNLINTPVTLYGDGFEVGGHNTGSLLNYTGDNVYTGMLVLGSDATLGTESGSSLTIGDTSGITTTIGQANGNGSYTLTKELSGDLYLSTADSYQGNTYVMQGRLFVENSAALGANSSMVEVLDGAQVLLQNLNPAGAALTLLQTLFLSGTGQANDGALLNVAGNNIWAGPVNLTSLPAFSTASTPQSTVDIGVAQSTSGSPSSLTLQGPLGQATTPPTPPVPADQQSAYSVNPNNYANFGLNKVGLGELLLTNNSDSYGGGTNVLAGTVDVQANDALGAPSSTVTVPSDATLALDTTTSLNISSYYLVLNGIGDPNLLAGNNSPGALYNSTGNNTWTAKTSGFTLDGASASNDAIGAAASTYLFIVGNTPVITGQGSNTYPNLRVVDSGTVVFPSSSANYYLGPTFVDSGTLDVDGSLDTNPATGSVTVDGGTLEGSGTVGTVNATSGAVGGGDFVTPGGNPNGTLTATAVTLSGTAALDADITSNPSSGSLGTPGTNNSLLSTGSLITNSATTIGGLSANVGVGDSYIVAHSTSTTPPTMPVSPAYLSGIKYIVTTVQEGNNSWDIILTRSPETATVALAASTSSPQYGSDVTFTATITPPGGGTIPAGDYVLFTMSNASSQVLASAFIPVISDVATFDPAKYLALPNYPLQPGQQYSVSADFNPSGNSQFPPDPGFTSDEFSVPSSVSVTPIAANSNVVVTSSDLNAVYGEPVTITATVTSAAPNIVSSPPAAALPAVPTGTVTFYINGAPFGTVQTLSGTTPDTAQISLPAETAFTYGIYAVYSPGSDSAYYNGSTSPSIGQVINADGTTLTGTSNAITGSPDPSSYGQAVTFNVTLAANGNGGSYSGADLANQTITFSEGSTNLGSATTNASGQASFTTSVLAVGANQSIVAQYAGIANEYQPSTFTFGETVNQVNSSTTLSEMDSTSGKNSSGNNASSAFGDTLTYTATISPEPGQPLADPTGTVTFTITQGFTSGGAVVGTGTGTVANGQATFSPSNTLLMPGTYTITAVYSGDGNYVTSTSNPIHQTVTNATTTETLTAQPANGQDTYGTSVVFTATMTPNVSGTGSVSQNATVTFVSNPGPGQFVSPAIPVQANGTAQYTISTLLAGTYTITANYSGNTDFASNSQTLTPYVVSPAATTSSLTVTDVSSSTTYPGPHASSNYGDTVIYTASVAPQPGSPLLNPSGSFTFTIKQGSLTIATSSAQSVNASGQAAFQPSPTLLSTGNYTITASYSGDSNYTISSTNTITQTVSAAVTNTTLTLNPNNGSGPYSYGNEPTITATVDAVVLGTAVTTGTVTFWNGAVGSGTILGSGTTNSSGVAALTPPALPVGSYSITAVYGGSSNFATSSSSQTAVNIVADATSTTVSINPNHGSGPYYYGNEPTITAAVVDTITASPATSGTVTFWNGAVGTGTNLGSAAVNASGDVTLTPPALPVGNYSITAVYSGAATTATSSSSPAKTVDIVADSTSTTLSLNPNNGSGPYNYSAQPTISATVKDTITSTPLSTGTVTFWNGAVGTGTNLGSGSLNSSGVVTFDPPLLPVGNYTITAVYNGNGTADYGTSNSTATAVNIIDDTTSTTLTLNPNHGSGPYNYGAQPTISATVTDTTTSTPLSTGTVTFWNGTVGTGTILGSGTPNSSGVVTLDPPPLPLGNFSITAVYSGTATDATSKSAQTAVNIIADTTSTILSVNPSSGNSTYSFGAESTIAATVTDTTTSMPLSIGTVTFWNGTVGTGTILGSGTPNSNGVATLTPPALPVGNYSITAVYSGTATAASSNSGSATTVDIVGDSTSTTLTLNPNSSSYSYGNQPAITAAVLDTVVGTPVTTGTVTFWNGTPGTGTNLGSGTTNSNGVVTFSTPLGVGSYNITASYSPGSVNVTASNSNQASFTISPAATAVNLSSSDSNPAVGEQVTFTATVAITSAQGNSSFSPLGGTLSFYVNGTQIGSTYTVNATSSGITYSLNGSPISGSPTAVDTFGTQGQYTVKAQFTPSTGNYAGSQQTLTENAAQGTLVLTTPVGPSLTSSGTTIVNSGQKFSTVAVTYENAAGQAVAGYSGPITLSYSGPAGGLYVNGSQVISGHTVTVNCVNGVATFSNVVFEKLAQSGNGYTLTFSDNDTTLSPPPAPVSQSVLVVPTKVNAAATSTTGSTITTVQIGTKFDIAINSVTDPYGNLMSFNGSYVVSLSVVSGPGLLYGTTTATPANGASSYKFTNLTFKNAGTYVIGVTVQVAPGYSISTTVTISAYSVVTG